MTLLRRATDQQQSEWRPVDEGLWRWIVGVPELKLSEKFGNYQVRFPLMLTQAEQQRLEQEHGKPDQGIQQSWRAAYFVGLSLGYVQRDGQYKSTKLIDFLAACLGNENTKRFRDWIAKGGGPPRPADKDDQQAELSCIESWLGWWENLEVYGSIRHEADSQQSGVVWARFAGPMPVGSLPGQKDPDYQSLGRGKLRALIAESGDTAPDVAPEPIAAVAGPAGPAVQFTADGTQVAGPVADGSVELPF